MSAPPIRTGGLPSPLRFSPSPSPSPLSPPSASSSQPSTPNPLEHDLNYSFLTSPNFTSESDWLNATLSSSIPENTPNGFNPLSTIESSLQRTLNSLELNLNDTTSFVDRLIGDISSSVPRLTFDLQLMRENALLLRFTLDGIRKRGGGFGTESEVGKVMERMKVLDLVKTRMEAARDVLREAESWSTLESEVTGLVSEGQFLKAAERLAEAARSMVVFQNTAEYEGRRALMVSLQNQLEASLSSGLVKAIQERDVKGCKTFWNIFGMIQREQEFRSYYFGSRRSGLIEGWSTARLVDCTDEPATLQQLPPIPSLSSSIVTSARLSSPGPQKFSSFLSHFYSELHSLLTEERTYLPAIFPDPIPTLSSFIQTTLEGLSPSFPQRLNSIIESYGPTVLPELIASFKATEEFAVQVERIFLKLEPPPTIVTSQPSSPSVPPASPSKPNHSNSITSPSPNGPPSTPSKRRLSKRRSLSKRLSSRSISYALGSGPDFLNNGDHEDETEDEGGGRGSAHVRAWETALFEPFLDHQVDYPSLERSYLSHLISRSLGQDPSDWIDSLLPPNPTSISGQSGAPSEKGPKVLLERVGRVFGYLEDAVGRNLGLTHGYAAKECVGVMDEQLVAFLDKRKEDLVKVSRSRGQVAARRKSRRQGNGMGGEAGGEDEGLFGDGGEEMVLEGLEYSSQDWETFQFGLRLLDACRSISDKLIGFEGKLRSRMVILNHSIRQAREQPSTFTIPGTTRGEILLLRQSTLNSAELADMMRGLEAGGGFLLPRGKGASTDFTRTTQLFLHETILAPLLSHLNDYASLSCWTTSTDRPGGKGAFDLSIPTFSLSPTETISRVGEGLFNLPRLFEVYAQDDALAYSIETLPFVDLEALKSLQHPEPPPMLRQSSSSGHRPTLSDANSSGTRSTPQRTSISQLPPPPPAPSVPLSAETVIATWLSSLTLSILSHLTTTILPSLTRLSKHGSSQLVSDLDYISNVARALDVESPDELEGWREAVAMDEKQMKEGGGEDTEARIDKGILERVAKIRGFRRGSV